MQYRKFGKLDWKISALGFGCMRMPTTDGQRLSAKIDEPEAIRMIRHAADEGVNYFDTAYVYHGEQSEVVLGKALRDGYRSKVKVATKLPVWMVQEAADFDKLLAEQLKRLQTDHIDFYLLHALNATRWTDVVLKYDLLSKAAQAKRDGRIGNICFSVHDDYKSFEQIVSAFDWDMCQIQYNYMDTHNQAGTKGLKLAASRGMAVVVMEPLLGGRLVNPPAEACTVIEGFPVQKAPAEWALQWLWDQPEVSVVLSGMSTMGQVQDNLRFASSSKVGSFGEAEHKLIREVRDVYRARTAVPCTRCNYCMPCPNGVDIPANFDFFNHAHLYGDVADARFRYGIFVPEPARATTCIDCKECETKCPQKITIGGWMPKVADLLCAPSQ